MEAAMKRTVLAACLVAFGGRAFAQAPVLAPTSLNFSYLVNSGKFPPAAKLTATLPATVPSTTVMAVAFTSSPAGWLTVTPSGGYSPLTMSVTANPTSLSPGSYTGSVTVTAGNYQTSITVTLAVTNPPSSLIVTSPNYDPLASGSTIPSITFNYTSGGALPSAEVDVSTTGDIIPFSVATAVSKGSGSGTVTNWLRVSNGGLPSTSTSGVAASGSNVKISVSPDQSTLNGLDAILYYATITIAAQNSVNGTATINVILNVSAGQPVFAASNPIFPSSMAAFPVAPLVKPVDPVITLYGDNFFTSSSHVFMAQGNGVPVPLATTWLSRQVLQATIPAAYLTPPQSAPPPTVVWTVTVVNGAAGATPSNGAATTNPPATFTVTDPTLPYVQSIVNAASYLSTAAQLGPNANPVVSPNTAISPREIVSIFGGNLGPTTLVSATPVGSPLMYPTTIPGYPNVSVAFQVGQNSAMAAPLIMISANQINAIVPDGLSMYPTGTPVTVLVSNNGSTFSYTTNTIVPEDPGIFTFGGNGQGQAAVLNFDASTGSVTVNGSKQAAPRGSAIEIYATGLGDLVPVNGAPLPDGLVAAGANKLLDDTYRVTIGGQSAAVFYAGTAGNGVAGLVQINAIVPPNSATGSAIPITVEIGPPTQAGAVTARRSQAGATIAVK